MASVTELATEPEATAQVGTEYSAFSTNSSQTHRNGQADLLVDKARSCPHPSPMPPRRWLLAAAVLLGAAVTMALVLVVVNVSGDGDDDDRLIRADGARLYRDGRPLFLNGINLAWISYGADLDTRPEVGFGDFSYCSIRNATRFVSLNGGNAMRVWLFADAAPGAMLTLSSDGNVTGLAPGVIEMLLDLLDLAHSHGVALILSLWNGALVRTPLECSLFNDDAALSAFIHTALTPLAQAVFKHPGLAMWEVVNEPEGVLDITAPPRHQGDACTDLAPMLHCAGPSNQPGWNHDKGGTCSVSMHRLQVFINRQAAALKAADASHLVSTGSWSHCALSSAAGGYNYFSDQCLRTAGGVNTGILDVWQVHTYPKEDDGRRFAPDEPVHRPAIFYSNLARRPLIIGEISNRYARGSDPGPTATLSMASIYTGAVQHGYAGVFGWAWTCLPHEDNGCVNQSGLAEGLRSAAPADLQGEGSDLNDEGLGLDGEGFDLGGEGLGLRGEGSDARGAGAERTGEASELGGETGPPVDGLELSRMERLRDRVNVCDCRDNEPPDDKYTCGQQAMWGKCTEKWLAPPYCMGWCHHCGRPPPHNTSSGGFR